MYQEYRAQSAGIFSGFARTPPRSSKPDPCGELLAHRLVHRVGRFTSESRTIERFARADRAIASDVVFFISSQKGSTDA
jgi:hypothetical protein